MQEPFPPAAGSDRGGASLPVCAPCAA